MMRALVLLGMSLIVMSFGQQTQRPSNDWYGVNVGDPSPPGHVPVEPHAPDEAWEWPNGQPPPPWNWGMVLRDKDGRVASIDLSDARGIMLDVAPDVSRMPIADIQRRMENGAAVKAYAIARLGPPNNISDTGSQSRFGNVSLRWDFIDRFVRCDGNKPVFAATAREPSGLIARAELDYGPTSIHLRIVGKRDDDAAGDAANERDVGARACVREATEPDAVAETSRGIEQFCAHNPDRCVSPVPGVLVIPAPGVTVVPTRCPKQTKHTECFKGQNKDPMKDEAPGS